MSFGIGLGAFMSGMQGGMQMRETMDTNKRQRETRSKLDEIAADAEARFGDVMSDEAVDFMFKRQAMVLARDGNPQAAAQLMEWSRDNENRAYSKLYGTAIRQAQLGDTTGAMDIARRLLEHRLPEGATLNITPQPVQGANGEGFGIEIKYPDQEEPFRTIMPSDQEGMSRFLATIGDPVSVMQSQSTEAQRQRERKEGLEDFETKEGIRASHRASSTPDYEDRYRKAREDLAKNDLGSGDEPAFVDLSPEEQDRKVRQVLDQAERYSQERGGEGGRGGGGGGGQQAPRDQIIVDQQEGGVVGGRGGDSGQEAQPPGLGSDPATEADQAAASRPGLGDALRSAGSKAWENLSGDPWRKPEQAAPTRGAGAAGGDRGHEQLLSEAAREIGRGGNPQQIATRLSQAGIAPSQWPTELRSVMSRGSPGLGGGW